jgi:hypothetical protein
MRVRDEVARIRATYGIHARNKGIVRSRVIPCRDKEAASLSCAEIYHLCLCLVGIDAVDLDYSHVMTFKPDVLAGNSAHVDHMEQIRLSGLDRDCQVLSVVE